MHEYHSVEALVKEVTKKAKEKGASKVRNINVVMGKRRGFSEESVCMYFETLGDKDLFEGVSVKILSAPGEEFYIDNIEIEE